VVTGGAGLALLAVPHLAASLLATAIIGLSYGPLTPASSHVLARYRSGAGMAFLVSVRQTSVPMGGVLASHRRSSSGWAGTPPAWPSAG
jgi:hypothetical protein